MTPDEVLQNAETLELISNELASSHDRQSGALDKIDNKAVLLVGYALAAGSFLATRSAQPVLAGLAYAAYAVAALFGISAYAIRGYQDIDPRPLYKKYAGKSKAETLAALGAMRVKRYEFNNGLLKKKARQWSRSLAAVIFGTVLMIAAIEVQTYQHDHPHRAGGPAGHTGQSAVRRPGASPAESGAGAGWLV